MLNNEVTLPYFLFEYGTILRLPLVSHNHPSTDVDDVGTKSSNNQQAATQADYRNLKMKQDLC
jgi:hypothetical protein